MPYETHYVDSGKGVHKIGSGVVTSAEIIHGAIQEAADEERARKLKYGLVDFSQITELQVTTTMIRQIVEINRKLATFTPGVFVALVAPSPLAYGMSRLWLTFSEDLGWKAQVFRHRPDAIVWLRKNLGAGDDTIDVCEAYPSLKTDD